MKSTSNKQCMNSEFLFLCLYFLEGANVSSLHTVSFNLSTETRRISPSPYLILIGKIISWGSFLIVVLS